MDRVDSQLTGVLASALFFKSVGLWFLNGPTQENRELLSKVLVYAQEKALAKSEIIQVMQEKLMTSQIENEYGSLFCLGKDSVSLYESVWKTGLVMQEPRDKMRKILVALGLKVSGISNEPEDHVGLILYIYGEILERMYLERTNVCDVKKKNQQIELLNFLAELESHMDWLSHLKNTVDNRQGYFHSLLITMSMEELSLNSLKR